MKEETGKCAGIDAATRDDLSEFQGARSTDAGTFPAACDLPARSQQRPNPEQAYGAKWYEDVDAAVL